MHDSGNLLDSSLEVLERTSVRLKLSSALPVGGRLKHFWPVWKQMGAENGTESGTLASAGVPSPIQAGNLSRQTISSVNCSAPSNAGRELRRSVESECHGRDVTNGIRQKVCKAHGAR